MSQDLPIPRQDNRSDDVMVWGGDDSRRPGRVAPSLARLGRDHRLPLVLAGLGAVAAVASLIGEWLVITVPNSGPEGTTTIRVPSGVADVGFGLAYLVGLFGLAGALALALRGTGAVRHNARVAGLGFAVTLLAVLIAATVSLDDSGQRTLFYVPEEGFQIDYGRGLTAAFVATVLLAAALHLSGRVAPSPAAAEQPGDGASPAERGRGRTPADDDLPPPADLTVEPTVPFARPEPPR